MFISLLLSAYCLAKICFFFIRTNFLTKNIQKVDKKQGMFRFYTLFVLFLPQTITLSP